MSFEKESEIESFFINEKNLKDDRFRINLTLEEGRHKWLDECIRQVKEDLSRIHF